MSSERTQTVETSCEVEDNFVSSGFLEKCILLSTLPSAPLLLDVPAAMAVDREYGILEGTSAALVHPIVMGGLLLATLYAGYLGWQWRRVRTLQDDITALKKQVPVPAAEGAAPSPAELQIQTLSEERKQLVKGNFRERHFNVGSILLGGGVLIAVEGCVNTFLRTGRLYPGPHLYAGAGIVVLWAVAAALVPAMQKGNNSARNAHIALNALNVLLFLWQVPTGLDIVQKVFQFTTFP